MKNTFKEHHIIENLEDIYKNSIIVLDTNSILNLYRYSESNRKKYFEILKQVEERLYLTNHICNEFYKNRLIIIENRSTFKENINELINENQKKLINVIQNSTGTEKYNSALSILKHESPLQYSIINEIEKSLKKISKIITEFKQDFEIKYIQGEDPILEEITKIIQEKISPEISLIEKEKLFKEGEKRYENEIPPGYKDINKPKNEKFGDLIIWNELQNLAKETEKSVLFISDDRKDDWAIKFKGYDLGPRKELIKEFLTNTGKLFYSITTTKFIQLISESFKISNTEKLEEETEIIQKNINSDNIYYANKYDINEQFIKIFNDPRHYQNEIEDYKSYSDYINQIQKLTEFKPEYLNNLKDYSQSLEIIKEINDYKKIRNFYNHLRDYKNPIEELKKTQEALKQIRKKDDRSDDNLENV
ncbi:PIN-like domain-containing protein [Flavobacterium collinsii]|uniref:PIN_8 domain-containing protein n=1 Tax=Flavobacterium collinsii TaxID=1114861 RepID=A0A9W4X4J4_9FLAO|nr:PIN domain-containing protein [Flavobacterium collinsii]CAI2768521.1 PIN_8 domain-containing protein [Flavobacterium collinsii]